MLNVDITNVEELENEIMQAAQKYYADGSSPYTDEEFDYLVDALKSACPDSHVLAKVGWGYKVESDSYRQKVEHKYGLVGSLDKCRTWEELSTSFRDSNVDVSLKLDGMSVVLYYESGILKNAVTRGDGTYGIDITPKVQYLLSQIQPKIPPKFADFTGAIRGEILMKQSVFEEYAQTHPEAKNPRNTAAGIINSKDAPDLKYLTIIFYTIVGAESCTFNKLSDVREKLIDMFGAASVVTYQSVHLQQDTFISQMNAIRDYWYLQDIPADGLVITQFDVNTSANGSVTYTAQAYKFPSEVKSATVVDVEYTMSKTHYAIPKIRITPVTLAGTTVEYASGFNAQYIKDQNIGPGAQVLITKANEIIPYIVEVTSKTSAKLLDECPQCKEPLTWKGVHLVCDNIECANSIEQDTLIWITSLVPRDNFGKLLILKYLESMQSMYNWKDISIESIMDSTAILSEGDKVQDNIWVDMWNSLHSDLTSFNLQSALAAVNIPRLGTKTIDKLIQYKDVFKDLYHKLIEDSDRSDIYAVLSGLIGIANTESLKQNETKLLRLQYIWHRILWITVDVQHKGTVAITGKLSVKRADFEQELKSFGWNADNISKNTDYLITDNPDSSSSKTKFAKENNIPMMSESEFREKFLASHPISTTKNQVSTKKLF